MLAPIIVNHSGDFIDSNAGITTLREAIQQANLSPDHDTIEFASNLNNTTITLSSTSGFRTLAITQPLIINGRDALGNSRNITIDANNYGADHMPFTGDGFSIFNIVGSTGSEQIEINSLRLTGSDTFLSNVIGASYANLALKNVVVTGNNGGAMIGTNVSNVTVENSTISGNSGHGIDFDDSQYLGRQLNISASTISGNTSFVAGGSVTVSGGGMRIRGFYTSASIQASVITGNESTSSGGGVSFLDGHELQIGSSTIDDNTAAINGGGLYARVSYEATVAIDNSSIDWNRSINGGSAGAGAFVSCDNSSVTITNSTVSSNKALGIEANVGGLAVIATNNSSVVLDGLAIIGNHADDDIGGLVMDNTASAITLRNSMVSGNTASHNSFFDAAGGVWLQTKNGGSNIIEYSTISDNKVSRQINLTDFLGFALTRPCRMQWRFNGLNRSIARSSR